MDIDIPLNAGVYCQDGRCGTSAYVIIDPVKDIVTHVVVRLEDSYNEVLIPMERIAEADSTHVLLNCVRQDLKYFPSFMAVHFIEGIYPYMSYPAGQYMFWPYAILETTEEIKKQIPPGELPVGKGTRVKALDKYVGEIDEFLVNPESGHITHLVLRKGHFWGQRDVTIPVSFIDHIGEAEVVLNIGQDKVGELPSAPIKRKW
jgi:hypothetical protein